MNYNPLVSIICLTYNHDKYIGKTIEGILMQDTNFDYELIIANDCSPDKTDDIVQDYIRNHPKGSLIKYFKQEKNLGSQRNFIFAHEKCFGKYIAICEGDDYWTNPLKLQNQVEFLEKAEEYSMCFTNSTIVDEYGNIKKTNRVDEQNKKDITQADILNGFVPPMNTVLYRNKYFKKIIDDFPKITNGDYYVSALMANYGKIGYLDINTAAYRIHKSGSWSQLPEESRLLIFTKTLMSLKGKLREPLNRILENKIRDNLAALTELNKKDQFLENNFWTPQTVMFRSIRDTVLKIDGFPQNALNIDNHTTLEKILCRKWPEMEITKTSFLQYDVQSLHQFVDESFDIVFSQNVLEHIPKPWLAAKEMNRVLKRGGIGIHTACAYNPRKNHAAYKDYYRFLPDGLAELFEGVNIWIKESWGNKQALIYNLTFEDKPGMLSSSTFFENLAIKNDVNYPWHTWVIFQKP